MIEQKIKEICERNNFKEPVELLVGLTNGVDLRKLNVVYSWLMAFEEEYGEEEVPDALEWFEFKELIKHESKFQTISTSESLTAQKALIEYQHPKKKSIDVTANINTNAKVKPLNSREIARFKRKFNKMV